MAIESWPRFGSVNLLYVLKSVAGIVLMKNTCLETLFQHVETLQQRKLYWKQRTISMPCVLLTVLLNRLLLPVSRHKWQVLKIKILGEIWFSELTQRGPLNFRMSVWWLASMLLVAVSVGVLVPVTGCLYIKSCDTGQQQYLDRHYCSTAPGQNRWMSLNSLWPSDTYGDRDLGLHWLR